MSSLRVYLLGQVQVFGLASQHPIKIPRQAQALLAYLMLQRHRSHPRDVLAELFWGDHGQNQARTCMNTAIWRLRHAIEPEHRSSGSFVLSAESGDVSFNPQSDYWLDVATFEDQSADALELSIEKMRDVDVHSLRSALHVYRGDLLEGFTNDWAIRERERLRTIQLNILVQLMRYYTHQNNYKEGIEWGQRVLAQEPLREEIQREVMRLYVADGQRPQALRQYELCRQVLAAELDIAPMEETQTLHAEILRGDAEQSSTTFESRSSSQQRVLDELRLAMRGFDEARAHLKLVMQLLEKTIQR